MRSSSQKFRVARFQLDLYNSCPRPIALMKHLKEVCAMNFSFKTCGLVLALAAVQCSCGGGSSATFSSPAASNPAPRMSRVFVVVEENPGQLGWGASVAAIAAQEAFSDLTAPVTRVSGGNVPHLAGAAPSARLASRIGGQ